MSFRIVVEPDAKDYGLIFVLINEEPFPDFEWRDFVFSVLSEWLQALQALESGQVGRNVFLEGPIEFHTQQEGDDVAIRCVTRSRRATSYALPPEIRIPKRHYKQTLLKACAQAYQVASRRKLLPDETFCRLLLDFGVGPG